MDAETEAGVKVTSSEVTQLVAEVGFELKTSLAVFFFLTTLHYFKSFSGLPLSLSSFFHSTKGLYGLY